MRPKTASAGEVIFAPGDPSDAVYIIEEGEISIRVGEGAAETEIARLLTGELFGEAGVLERRPRISRAVATRPTALLVTPADDFMHAFCLENDRSLIILKLLCKRLRGSTLRLAQPDPEPPDETAPAVLLFPADDRVAAAMPATVELAYLPFQVGNRFGAESLPITSNRSLCIPAHGDLELSTPHFEIVRRGRQFSVRDLESRYGTIVNGNALHGGALDPFVPLRLGDNFVTAGRPASPFKFRIRLEPRAVTAS